MKAPGQERAEKITGKPAKHKKGKDCGYTLSGGKLFVAPAYKVPLDACIAERRAVHELLNNAQEYARMHLARIAARENELVNQAKEEYGILADGKEWIYLYAGWFEERPQAKDKKEK